MNIYDFIKNCRIIDTFYRRSSQIMDVTDERREKLIKMHPKQFISNIEIPAYLIIYVYETVRKKRNGDKVRKHKGEVVLFELNMPENDYELGIMLEGRLNDYIFKYNCTHPFAERSNVKILDYCDYGILRPDFQ